jgi:hypothetical protein
VPRVPRKVRVKQGTKGTQTWQGGAELGHHQAWHPVQRMEGNHKAAWWESGGGLDVQLGPGLGPGIIVRPESDKESDGSQDMRRGKTRMGQVWDQRAWESDRAWVWGMMGDRVQE